MMFIKLNNFNYKTFPIKFTSKSNKLKKTPKPIHNSTHTLKKCKNKFIHKNASKDELNTANEEIKGFYIEIYSTSNEDIITNKVFFSLKKITI